MKRRTYHVTVSREDGYWVAVVQGLRGGATETRRLDRLEDQVRDLVSWLTDTPEDGFDLRWEYELPPALAGRVRAFAEQRDALKGAQQAYDRAVRDAVAEARIEAISVRDAGALLGLSHQRVQQIDAEIRSSTGTRSGGGERVPVKMAKKSTKRAAAESTPTRRGGHVPATA